MTIFKTHLTHQSPIVPALPKPKDSLRLLHTSDWHLGKLLYNQSRYDEFAKFLDWLIEALILHQVDILIIAGDIFDTMTPSNRAEYLYHHFLASAFKITFSTSSLSQAIMTLPPAYKNQRSTRRAKYPCDWQCQPRQI